MNLPASGITQGTNPATGAVVGSMPNSDLAQLPAMVQKARRAQQAWAQTSFRERALHVRRMRQYIVAHAEELAGIVSRSNGKTRIDALATEVLPVALACDWYAKNAGKVLAPESRGPSSLLFFNKRTQMLRLPVGVVGIISPWNYPLSIPFGEVVMGLMAGNAIILKVAAATPLVGKAIDDIVAAAGLPDGLYQQVVGAGGAVSDAMLESGIDKLFFTGSVAVGQQLMVKAAKTLTPLSLELGGNDPMIVLADADLERATNGAAWAGYQNAGQSCGGVERIYVHEAVYDEFVRLLAAKTAAMRHGPGDQRFDVDMGAMTTRGQLNTVTRHLNDALAKGAQVVAQSQPVGDVSQGHFHPATLLTGVTHDMDTMKDETFGPLLPVMKFSDIDEAVRLANDSYLGLTSSVWTRDLARGRAIAARLQTGVTTINDHLYTHGLSETPWGGWKQSGIGRTHGAEGLHEMTQAKVVNWDLLPSNRNVWWYPFNEETWDGLLAALRFVYPESPADWVKAQAKLTPFMLRKMFGRWEP